MEKTMAMSSKPFRSEAAGVKGFIYVDMIIPIFMFILGISVPLALEKRIARERSSIRVFGHVLILDILPDKI